MQSAKQTYHLWKSGDSMTGMDPKLILWSKTGQNANPKQMVSQLKL
jgi:hypothetical protein